MGRGVGVGGGAATPLASVWMSVMSVQTCVRRVCAWSLARTTGALETK